MRAAPLTPSDADRGWLVRRLTSGEPAELAQRAHVVLLAADGLRNVDIAEKLDLSLPTVAKWRNRFAEAGLAGLVDLPRSGRPRSVDHDQVIAATLQSPPTELGATHWSSRMLAAQLGIGDATVARIWREYGLAPRPRETFEFGLSPVLVAGSVDVLGLCLTPGWRVAVLSVDDHLGVPIGSRPDSVGRVAYAAEDESGGPSDRRPPDASPAAHRIRELIRQLQHAYPNRELHVAVSGSASTRPASAADPTGGHPEPCIHKVATHDQWLKLVEVWFLLMVARSPDGSIVCPIERVRDLARSGQSGAWIKRAPGRAAEPAGRWARRRRRTGWERDSA